MDERFTSIARWIKDHGWIELGDNEMSLSLVRALDIGGLAWESREDYATLEEMLQALEAGLAMVLREQVGKR